MKPLKIKLLIALTLIIGASLTASAQAVDLKGRVTVEGNASPVVGAVLTLEPSGLKATTDSNGNFLFKKLADGKYQLTISHPRFVTVKKKVTVKGKADQKLNIELSPIKNQNYKSQEDSNAGSHQEAKEKDEAEVGNSADLRQSIMYAPQIAETLVPQSQSKSGTTYGQTDLSRTKRTVDQSGGTYSDIQLIPPPFTPNPDAMYFQNYGTNRFVDTRRDPLSTFALDVDDGSFNIVKEYLERGVMPPTDAIRVEEFINHFDYGYADPQNKPFRMFTEMVTSPTDRDLTILKVGIKGRELPRDDRQPLNLTLVIDVSGSMRTENRIGLVKQSIQLLLGQLDPQDRIGIVAYGSNARVVLHPTSAAHTREIMNAVQSLYPQGSTYAEAGLKLGYQMANGMYDRRRINRVILCSDGVANVGKTSPDAIMADISEFARKGITLATFGFGMGNYNDVLLEQLAIKGNGRYAYVNDRNEATRLFVNQFVANIGMLARDAKIQLRFNPKMVASYRLIGYENRAVADNQFRNNHQDGGEIGPGHEVTAVYELRLTGKHHGWFASDLGDVTLRWTSANGREVSEISREIDTDDLTNRFDDARPELRLAVVASQFAGVLKDTRYDKNVSYGRLIDEARSIDRQLHSDQTRELVALIQRAAQLDDRYPEHDDDDYYSRY